MSAHAPAYRKFLVRLRDARARAGLTQAEVARQLGRPQSFMAKVECGERRLDVIELQAIAKIYRRSVAWFLR